MNKNQRLNFIQKKNKVSKLTINSQFIQNKNPYLIINYCLFTKEQNIIFVFKLALYLRKA